MSQRKKVWVSRDETVSTGGVESLPDLLHPEVSISQPSPPHPPAGAPSNDDLEDGIVDEGEDMSLALRRPRHQNQQLPKRFQDVLPQPPPTVPAELADRLPESVGRIVRNPARPASTVRSVFCTPPNIFRLVRQYFSSKPPSHNPEQYMTIADLSFIPGFPQVNKTPEELPPCNNRFYYPDPNRSSFQLGDWYWNQGLQKSQVDYKKLLEIVGDDSFNAADVTSTKWKNINSILGANEYDEGGGEEWEDEDAGWKRSPISIEVPSSHTTEIPGPRVYEAAAHLYH